MKLIPPLLLGSAVLFSGCTRPGDDAVQPDTKSPEVSIVSPAGDAVITDNTVVVAEASDNVGVVKVELFVDGFLLSAKTSPPWEYAWNVLAFPVGSPHSVQAVAYDAAGNIGSSRNIPVTVNKSDLVAPRVSILSPAPDSYISDQVLISASPTDNIGVAKVEFSIDGTLMSAVLKSPWQYIWNTLPLAILSTHSILVTAYDRSGNVGSAAVGNLRIRMGNHEYPMDYATVGLWHLNEGGSRVSDASVGFNYGTATGTSVVVGRFYNARKFFFAADNIRLKNLPIYRLQNFTVEAWVLNQSANPAGEGSTLPCIVGMVDGSASDGGATLGITPDLAFLFSVRGTAGTMTVTSASEALVGQWVHVAGTRITDREGGTTTLKLFVNGILEASQDFPGNQASYVNTVNIYFGNQGDSLTGGSRRWIGLIDEIRFSNRERSYYEFNLP